MSTWLAYLDDIAFTFKKHKAMAEKAIDQLSAEDFIKKPGADSNSVAAIIKHVAGNLRSRWTDFLTTDGDKPWRDRDAEFTIGPEDTRERLITQWNDGFDALFVTLANLKESDWTKTVLIRGEAHTVMQAIHRSLAHTCYHVGQINYLARLSTTDGWRWITIPPGQSKEHTAAGKKYLQ